MISLETKPAPSTSHSTVTATEDETSSPTLSFSELLRGATTSKDSQTSQNGVIVLALNEESEPQESLESTTAKPNTLLSLLKTGDSSTSEESLTQNLSSQELKSLTGDAKNYLKNQIVTSEGFKKSEVESLPKTLKGLVQVAEKYGIDVDNITLDEINPDTKTTKQTQVQVKTLPQMQGVQGTQGNNKSLVTTQTTQVVDDDSLEEEAKFQESLKVDKNSTSLLKAQGSKEISTEQFVQTKVSVVTPSETKTSKDRADDTLKMLLQGKTPSKTESGLTADFSVATARVIAPKAESDVSKDLESLLKGDDKESATPVKTDAPTVSKADSLEVKLNEAKQMTKYLSSDVKSAIEDYKSPFTRVKVQLNPQNLGEIDLTIVQRGKNLHINLSSNNAAINTLALNANDLKAQLSNNGINNATLNFNNNSQSSDPSFSGGQQQQQNPQQGRDASREYNYFENEEQNEEMLSSLEIVVPHYA